MSEKKHTDEIRNVSLSRRVMRTAVMGTLVLGLATLLMGLFMNAYTLIEQAINSSSQVAMNAMGNINMAVDYQYMKNAVAEIYDSLTEEELEQTHTEAYREKFIHLLSDEEFGECYNQLVDLASSEEVNDVYLAYIDEERSALVYIYDPDLSDETGCYPGDWEPLQEREMRKFLDPDKIGRRYDIGNTERYGFMVTSAVPLYDNGGHGGIVAFAMADVTLANVMTKLGHFIFRFAFGLIVVSILFGWRLNKRMKRTLVEPINQITDAARKYVADRQQGIASNHFSQLDIKTGDELEKLGNLMGDMEQALSDYETNLTIYTAERERIVTELSLAEKIQASMLMKKFPAFPDRHEFDIHAVMDPAREVGGDFYDFYLIDDDHLALTIADVSGKGVPGALIMMASMIKFADFFELGKSPAEVLEAVNRSICASNEQQMFVTAWAGILEISTGKVTAANAGHEYPILRQPDGDYEIYKDKHSLVLGAMENIVYHEYSFTMKPGAALFVYTDGVPEATDMNEELFGLERTVETLNRHKDDSCAEILTAVHGAVDEFVKEAEQFDDLTMMCVKYFGPEKSES